MRQGAGANVMKEWSKMRECGASREQATLDRVSQAQNQVSGSYGSLHRLCAYVAAESRGPATSAPRLCSIALNCSASIFLASLQPHCHTLVVFSPLAHKTLSSSYVLFYTLTTIWIRRTCPRPRSEPVSLPSLQSTTPPSPPTPRHL
jgi:hypothetical protein